MHVRIGCCGFPRARSVYYRTFSLVEVQQTFYHPPQATTLQRWRQEAPAGFVFTIKAWQRITHPGNSPTYRRDRGLSEVERTEVGFFRPTAAVTHAWEVTRRVAERLQAPVVIFQCPPSFTPTPEHVAWMRTFFRHVERGSLRFGWEPRGPWPAEQVQRLCRELDLIHVTDPFHGPSLHGTPTYWRLHGRTGYRYRYTEADLSQLTTWVQALKGEVYCLFNNRFMWEDAQRLKQKLGDLYSRPAP